jgi:RNA polymerase sigma factor (sigma-70 family)
MYVNPTRFGAACFGVMPRALTRSVGVTSTLTLSRTASPATPALDFEALYRAARDDVYAYVATLLHDRAAAEDVTAAAFERAYRKQRTYDPRRGAERAWLFGIARNAALDELRKRKRHAALAAEPADTASAAPEDALEAAFNRAALRSALATLSARDREVVALKFHAGLDNSELAAVLGVSASNAGTLLHRAMTKLREAIDAD